MDMDRIFLGRQAIYDQSFNLFGYELFYRADELNHARFSDGHLASSHVILTTFLDIGLERTVGSNHAFINLTREFIDGAIHLPVAPEQVVLEISDRLEPTDGIIDGLRHLVERGFTIALDDALLHEANEALLELVHIIKIDTRAHDLDGIRTLYERLRTYPVKLLAKKIESEEMFRFCRTLGFDYFQGFYLQRPDVISGRHLPNNAIIIRQLLSKLQQPQVQLGEVEQLLRLDASLLYQLLRYLNCASYEIRQELNSAQQAIRLLGLTALHQWVKLIDMKQFTREQPRELLLRGLVRARMCECLAHHAANICSEQAFTVGQLSILGKMLNTPLDELLDDVPLSMPVKLAVLEHHGTLGALLAQSTACEAAEWSTTPTSSQRRCYRDAVTWANTQFPAIHA